MNESSHYFGKNDLGDKFEAKTEKEIKKKIFQTTREEQRMRERKREREREKERERDREREKERDSTICPRRNYIEITGRKKKENGFFFFCSLRVSEIEIETQAYNNYSQRGV